MLACFGLEGRTKLCRRQVGAASEGEVALLTAPYPYADPLHSLG